MPAPALPRGWTQHVRSSLLHAISLAAAALTLARAKTATRTLRAELERAHSEIALLKEELDLKDSRWIRLSPRRRPHYKPVQRMRILQLKAARGWSCSQAAQALMLDEQTLKSWMRRIDEEGENALVRLSEPVNRFPDFVRTLVRQLRTLCPTMGKVRIAQVLARAGLHLGATTVERILRETQPLPEEMASPVTITTRRVTARSPGDLWHIDLTAVPTGGGLWLSWLPFTLPQRWPFCWWVLVVVDHVSRAVIGLEIFGGTPSARGVRRAVARIIRRVGNPPRYVITDQGRQFRSGTWARFCRGHRIRSRFGAVGKHGSIAVVERMIRTIKSECTSRILVSLDKVSMKRELMMYAFWYNAHRPSQALGGRTPTEVYTGHRPACTRPRWEPRRRWPREASCAAPHAELRSSPGVELQLVVSYLEGRRHLPIVEVRGAA